jgi:hypothetical protein
MVVLDEKINATRVFSISFSTEDDLSAEILQEKSPGCARFFLQRRAPDSVWSSINIDSPYMISWKYTG